MTNPIKNKNDIQFQYIEYSMMGNHDAREIMPKLLDGLVKLRKKAWET